MRRFTGVVCSNLPDRPGYLDGQLTTAVDGVAFLCLDTNHDGVSGSDCRWTLTTGRQRRRARGDVITRV